MAIDFVASGQAPALEFINKDMLVSASAGSGKTTVMVEKILRYLEEGSITRIIVLTFTKASASDMREKLMERLSDAVRLGGEKASHYKEQIRQLPFAYIGTIDSICGQICTRYFEIVGLNPALETLDDEEAKALRSLAMDEVFEDLIRKGDQNFDEIASLYGNAKTFDGLKETMGIVLNFLSAQENPEAFINFAKEEAQKDFLDSGAVKNLIAYYRKSCGFLRPRLNNLVAKSLKIRESTDKEREANYNKAVELEDFCSSVTYADDEGFIDFISNYGSLSRMPSKSVKSSFANNDFVACLGDYNEKIKELLEKAKEVFGKGVEGCRKEDEESRGYVSKLLDIVSLVREKYATLKKEESKKDFEDVERNALAIFEHEEIAKEFSEGIDHVFLDEYQDTNKLQEAIFKKIARDNLFMVGDVKQAIYGFREAEPQIFLDKLKRYQTGKEGKNVPLNKNFRSAQTVLTFVDRVFSELMTYDFGGIDYKEDSTFGKAGIKDKDLQMTPEVEVVVFSNKEKEKKAADDFVYSVEGGKKVVKEECDEDWYIANKIAELVERETIIDKETGLRRRLRYGDIAILYRSKTPSAGTRKVFDKVGIPYRAEGFDGEISNEDLDKINNYLRTIDNYKQDRCLAGSMLSPFGGFTEKELSEIRKQNYKKYYFHEALALYDGALNDKISRFFERLKEYKKLSALVDVPTLIGKIMTDSGYLTALLADGKTDRISYYNAFIQELRTKKHAQNLQSYLEFLDSGVELEIEAPQRALDAVNMMTVHKSKGLEFPVVFIAHAGGKRNAVTEKQTIILDSRFGLGVNSFDESSGQTTKSTRKLAIERAIVEKENFEALRLMYVAFTRARCRLYVVGTTALTEYGVRLKGKGALTLPQELTSFMEWIIFASERDDMIKITRDPFVERRACLLDAPLSIVQKESAPLTFMDYAHEESISIFNKYTVTGLNVNNVDGVTYIPSSVPQSAEKGIAYHKVMELIDFNKHSLSEITAFIEELEREEVIERGMVDGEIIEKTLTHPLFDEVRKGNPLREQEFIYYAPACEVLEGVSARDKVLVQGVMDLIVEGEQNILLDYKVSGAPNEILRERYRKQIELYARAYEEMTGKKVSRKAVFVLNRGEVIEF